MSNVIATWYKVSTIYSGPSVTPVPVVKETERQLIVLEPHWDKAKPPVEKRTAKFSQSGDNYYPTFAAAKDALIERYTRGVESCERTLSAAKDSLAKAKALEESNAKQ